MTKEHARTTPVPGSVELAIAVIRWSLRFYWRHIGLVAGISLVPSVQRAVSQLWGAQLPEWAGVVGEIITAAARLVLFVLILRLAILHDDRLRGVPGDEAWQRIIGFVRGEWRSLLVQAVAFVTLFVVVDVLPERVVAPRVPTDAQPAYWATLLAIKNPTVIAFAMIWQVAAARQALLLGPRGASQRAPEGDVA